MLLPDRLRSIRRLGSTFESVESRLRYQSACLVRLVRDAGVQVPFYRDLFARCGLDPARFRGLEDLEGIPTSTKDDLFAGRTEDLLRWGRRGRRLVRRTTSGSTGRPFSVHCTWFEDRYLSLLRLRSFFRLGLRPSDHMAHIRFMDCDAAGRYPKVVRKRFPLRRLTWLNSNLSQFELAELLEEAQPDIVRGYSNVTTLVADVIRERGLKVRPRLVVVGADTLTPGMRKRLTEGFLAPVREVYGSHEFNLMAWECPTTGLLHVCDEGVLLEVLQDGRPVPAGERGEVVATALHSFAQPFIRYRIGDLVTRGPETCPCGAPYSTIQSIEGRIYDRILLPDGGLVSPQAILAPLEDFAPAVRQYQLVQESRGLVVVKVVLSGPPPPGCFEAVEEAMKRQLGSAMRHRIEVVEAIPPDRTGKFRASLSRVFSNYGIDADPVGLNREDREVGQ